MKSSEISEFKDKVTIVNNLDTALDYVKELRENKNTAEKAFFIGGAKLFEEASVHDKCRLFYLTKIGTEPECDTFLPKNYLENFRHVESSETHSENNVPYVFTKYLNTKFTG